MERKQGKVKWFNDTKGFGFICGESGQDVFVHHTDIATEGFRTLKEGETVEYDCEPSPKGFKATNVTRPSQQPPTTTPPATTTTPVSTPRIG